VAVEQSAQVSNFLIRKVEREVVGKYRRKGPRGQGEWCFR
jgi:hypothetical protein